MNNYSPSIGIGNVKVGPLSFETDTSSMIMYAVLIGVPFLAYKMGGPAFGIAAAVIEGYVFLGISGIH